MSTNDVHAHRRDCRRSTATLERLATIATALCLRRRGGADALPDFAPSRSISTTDWDGAILS
jgi:hypothetical protein